ncbi:MAG: hypothetical protein MRJ66_08815 [Nitrospira sp.]|nr:hypothetical protein [Nitrospira sp.]
MATILVISFTDLKRDPRVRRQIEALRTHHAVIAAGTGDPGMPDVQFLGCQRSVRTLAAKCAEGVELLLRRYETHYWRRSHVQELYHKLTGIEFDVVIANDIEALPLAIRLAERRPVILDAHEYAPKELEDQLIWRLFHKGHATYICESYVRKTVRVLTVADGIAEEYRRIYGVKPIIINNAASSYTLAPRKTSPRPIRMVHHGHAMPSRRIENMIQIMQGLDDRFEFDFMLIPSFPQYLKRLKAQASTDRRIRFLPPVSMEQLVPFSNDYDIGLYLLQPSNFNNVHALPNKFFEFLQARLAVAIGPSPEMAQIVRQFGCGVVAEDFSAAALAHELRQLTPADIDRMKAGSDRAAQVHTAERNAEKLREVVASVMKEL